MKTQTLLYDGFLYIGGVASPGVMRVEQRVFHRKALVAENEQEHVIEYVGCYVDSSDEQVVELARQGYAVTVAGCPSRTDRRFEWITSDAEPGYLAARFPDVHSALKTSQHTPMTGLAQGWFELVKMHTTMPLKLCVSEEMLLALERVRNDVKAWACVQCLVIATERGKP